VEKNFTDEIIYPLPQAVLLALNLSYRIALDTPWTAFTALVVMAFHNNIFLSVRRAS
jgi:hypothetical protein